MSEKTHSEELKSWKRLLAFAIFFAIVGCIIFYKYKHAVFTDPFLEEVFAVATEQKSTVQIEGKIISDPENKGTSFRYAVLIYSIKILGSKSNQENQNLQPSMQPPTDFPRKILVKDATQNIHEQLEFDDAVIFTAKLKKPSTIESEDGRVFDYAHYLSKDDIFFLAETSDVKKVDSMDQSVLNISKTWFQSSTENLAKELYALKRDFIAKTEKLLPAPHSFLAAGLVISGKGSLDKVLQEQFQRVGLIHIVVLSGFNISIVGEAIVKALSFLPKIIGGILGACGIIFFGIMTGGGATVWRSVIMAIIGIYARLSDRKNGALTSLFLAGCIMLLISPKLLMHDPSFQLSFMATLGLILFAEPFEKGLTKFARKICPILCRKVLDWKIAAALISLIGSTLATQIFTLPMIIDFSGVVSIIALPVNIIVLPFIPWTMLGVFLSVVLCYILPWFAYLGAFVSWILLSYELTIVRIASGFKLAAIKLPPISSATFFLMYVGLFLFAFVLNFRKLTSKSPSEKKLSTYPP